ncbi:hypothetical protein ILUMI_16708 [Ignelater luminosus]|uniref:CCHC-type domain-containing protein n=1 Tax=Ignelater luminosus TaxID=2038154 RepID=A0A8K0CTU0_IGNLU|nr:hypothetical protein ILUMI_16708 [Ignelater luminosus]
MEDRLTLLRKCEDRKWKENEKFNVYYIDKVLLANKLGPAEVDTIAYITDVMDNPKLQVQAKMKEFKTLSHLLSVINQISNYEGIRKSNNRNGNKALPKSLRCFNCYGVGHIASSCPKPRRQRGSCFSCSSNDHRVNNCPQKSAQSLRGNSSNPFERVNQYRCQENPRTTVMQIKIGKQSTELINKDLCNRDLLYDQHSSNYQPSLVIPQPVAVDSIRTKNANLSIQEQQEEAEDNEF